MIKDDQDDNYYEDDDYYDNNDQHDNYYSNMTYSLLSTSHVYILIYGGKVV